MRGAQKATPAMARLYIARHGNTFAPGEIPRRVGAKTDLPLVASGLVQAERLATHFNANRISFDAILSSPLQRARRTAEIIANHLGGAVEISDALTEIDHGPDENKPEEEVIARLGETALANWDMNGVAPDGWNADREKLIKGWEDIMAHAAAAKAPTLAVTSNGVARFALIALKAKMQSMKLRTGAFGVIDPTARRVVEWDQRPD
jgi:probable phosphoglycerate mutase